MNLEKLEQEIERLNGYADRFIEEGKELNKRARIHVKKAKILFGLDENEN